MYIIKCLKNCIMALSMTCSLIGNAYCDDFYLAITGDPQLPWKCGDGTLCQQSTKDKKPQAKLSNLWQTESINQLIAQYGSSFKGVIVNGDLTAFGHCDELAMYENYFANRIKADVYPGLGNHDYENNVNDCVSNNCALRMVSYLTHTIKKMKKKIVSFDSQKSKIYYKFPSIRHEHKGSLSYSFDIEGVHFIQLNNYPGYETSIKGWNFLRAHKEQYQITSSYNWLEQDLKNATEQGKSIIVNFHQTGPQDNIDKLQALFAKYKIAGAFWGHIHSMVGPSTIFGTTPGFFSGSSPYNTYLLAHFQDNRLTEVSVMDSSYGRAVVRESFLINQSPRSST